MWKTLVPVLAALTPFASSPARAIRPDGCVVPTVEVEGTLGYRGNAFGRMPDGTWVTTTRAFEWEGYFVQAGGKTYLLGLPPGHDGAEILRGKRVRVAGPLQHREVGFPGRRYAMPYLVVHSLASAGPVEVRGDLRFDPTEILRPYGVYWYVASGGRRYYLDFGKVKELEKLASTLTGKAVVTGRLEVHGRWLVVHVATLKAAEVLQKRAYEGNWEAADTLYSLKSGDRRPLVEHVRGLLAGDLRAGSGHSLRLEGGKLVVRTTAANHARIERFVRMLAMIPGPAR